MELHGSWRLYGALQQGRFTPKTQPAGGWPVVRLPQNKRSEGALDPALGPGVVRSLEGLSFFLGLPHAPFFPFDSRSPANGRGFLS
jgi:hypothetical protein